MARHAKVLQLLRDDKGICNASFRIIAQFYNAIRLRYMRIVFVFDFAFRIFAAGVQLRHRPLLDFLCLSIIAKLRACPLIKRYQMLIYSGFN